MSDLFTYWQHTWQRDPQRMVLLDLPAQRSYTAQDLHTEILLVAQRFQLVDGPPGRCLVMRGRNNLQWLAMFLAAQQYGWTVLPVDPDAGEDALMAMARSAGAARIVGGTAECAMDWPVQQYPDRPAILKSTSGSTGLPKLYPFSASAMIADGRHIIEGMGLRPDDKNFAHIAFGHSYGLGNLLMPLLLQGNPVVLATGYFPTAMIADLEQSEATVLPTVPALIRAFVESGAAADLPRSVRLVISAGGLLPPLTAQRFQGLSGRKVHNFYGSSETGGICFDADPDVDNAAGHAGLPLPGVQVSLEPESRRICVSSPALSDDFNVGSGQRSTLLYDCGHWLPGGQLQVTGRCDRDVKIAGKRLSLAEVERAVLAVDGVDLAWVGALPGANDEPLLAAAVVAALPVCEIKRSLQRRLPSWKRPRKWLQLEQMPLTARGKIDVAELRRHFNLNH